MTISSYARGAPAEPGARPHLARSEPGAPSLVWIFDHCLVAVNGLERALKKEFRVHCGQEPPENDVLSVVLCADGAEGLSESVERVRKLYPDAPVLVFGSRADLALARDALRAGARGFVHAGMAPDQVVRALKVALAGEIVAPRELLEYLVAGEETPDLNLLSPRQREILNLVADGLSNAQVARRVFLSESTVKQHLRAVYKLLGVTNRNEAARLVRNQSKRPLSERFPRGPLAEDL